MSSQEIILEAEVSLLLLDVINVQRYQSYAHYFINKILYSNSEETLDLNSDTSDHRIYIIFERNIFKKEQNRSPTSALKLEYKNSKLFY